MFRKILAGMKERVEGALAISLMSLDGIAIETINDSELSLDTLGAEFGSFAKTIIVANTELNTGNIEQLSVVTDRYITFLSAITPEYFILFVLSRDGNYGRARFELTKARYALRDELS